MLELNNAEIQTLESIADNAKGNGGVEAQGLLNFAYGYNYYDDYPFPTELPEFKKLDEKPNFRKQLEVYPNPSIDYVTIQFNGLITSNKNIVEILSVEGKVLDQILLSNENGLINYDTRKLEPGIYTCRLISGDKPIDHQKMIKIK